MRVYRGQFDAAEEAFRRAEELGRSPQPGRALLCLAQGEIDAAVSFIAAALADQTWDRLARARLLPAQVEIALAAARLTEARTAADELLAIADTYATIALSATAKQAHGRVLGAEGDAAAAAICLREAMRLWLDFPAPFEAARSRLALAEILRDLARIDEAQTEASVFTIDIHKIIIRLPAVELTGTKTMRDAAINLRARPEQRDIIDQAAQLLGKNRSDFMLEAACDRAQSVLLDQVFFRLDAAKFRQFAKLLDAPPAANSGLERLMAVKPPWSRKPAKR